MDEGHIITIKEFIQAIFLVSSRRSSLKLTQKTIIEASHMLKSNYPIFNHIDIVKDLSATNLISISISENIKSIHPSEIGKGIELLIRIIYEETSDESGLYFMTELKNNINNNYINHIINDFGVDLDKLQNEQHFSYNRKLKNKKREKNLKNKNPLGYSWSSVSNWKYNEKTKQVNLFDEKGDILDKIDLQQAIQKYVENLSGITEISSIDLDNLLEEHEKSYSFLKLLYYDNVSFETAKNILNLNDSEINKIIKDLINMKFLKYISDDEIELTESGKEFIT